MNLVCACFVGRSGGPPPEICIWWLTLHVDMHSNADSAMLVTKFRKAQCLPQHC